MVLKLFGKLRFLMNPQNTGLRPALLAIAVSVRRVSKNFFDKLVMSRFHRQVAMSKRLPKTQRLLRQIAQPFSEDNSYVVI